MPTATDLVTDLPADFEVFGQAVATDLADLLGGTTGQVLSKTSGTDMDFTWATPSGPAFSAWLNGSQSLTDGVATKIAYNAELFDTDGCFDPTTNYRFTPTKAGYYQINVTTYGSSTLNTRTFSRLYKNGSNYISLWDVIPPTGVVNAWFSGSGLVYMNGSSDYLEVYIRMTGTGLNAPGGSSTENQFSGVWIRN
jgi:hypothetical protein